jgi:hypothetical protein
VRNYPFEGQRKGEKSTPNKKPTSDGGNSAESPMLMMMKGDDLQRRLTLHHLPTIWGIPSFLSTQEP